MTLSDRQQQLTIPLIGHLSPGDSARVSIRAGDVVLATSEPVGISVRNVLRGTVVDLEPVADSAFSSSTSVNGG